MKNSASYTMEDIQHLLPAHLPEYKDKKLTIEPMIGLANQTYKVSAESLPSVLFQIYTYQRKQTLQIMRLIGVVGICPKILFSCEGYRIQEFIQEVEPMHSTKLFENLGLFKKLLEKLYELHQIQLPSDFKKTFLGSMVFDEEINKRRFNTSCPQPAKQAEFNQQKKDLIEQNSKLKQKIQKHFGGKSQHFRLCHNDLHSRNILRKKTQEGDELFLIDLDYLSYNYVAYDIANILTQTCYEIIRTNYAMTRTIGKEEIKQVCNLYPGKYEGIEKDVALMLAVVNYFYSLWALTCPAIEYFSIVEYSIKRWQMYKFYLERAE